VAAVSAMPPGQAGLASGVASSSRQVGQALGVAIAGSLLTVKAHGHMRTAFLLASTPAWHLLFWCAVAVVVSGLATTRARARHGATRSSGRRTPAAPEDVPLAPPDPVPPVMSQSLVSQTLPMRVPQASEWVPRFVRSPLPSEHLEHLDRPERPERPEHLDRPERPE